MSEQRIFHGNCLDVMKDMEDETYTAIVSDPPYALVSSGSNGKGFMGMEWDGELPSVEIWREALRVTKPGGTLLAFGGTRTYHRLACAIEDAGWIIKDCLMWVYGSGFPKSHNISKAIDKKLGLEREKIGKHPAPAGKANYKIRTADQDLYITAPASPESKLWDGYGTALKPAWEPIVFAQKPVEGTYADNALKHGVSGINIEETRISHNEECKVMKSQSNIDSIYQQSGRHADTLELKPSGRFPANVLLSHHSDCKLREIIGSTTYNWECVEGCPVYMLDHQGELQGSHPAGHSRSEVSGSENNYMGRGRDSGVRYGDKGGVSRFFHQSQLSPNVSPIVLAQKPLDGTYADNALKHNIAGLNIDDSRVEVKADDPNSRTNSSRYTSGQGVATSFGYTPDLEKGRGSEFMQQGRYPANFVHDGSEEVTGKFPQSKSDGGDGYRNSMFCGGEKTGGHGLGDSGSAARFFYCAKSSKRDRGSFNKHPTCKPINLMSYLLTLVKMPEGTKVLDPFMGSGTTLIAAKRVGVDCDGIDLSEEYIEIAKRRLSDDPEVIREEERALKLASRRDEPKKEDPQLKLFG